MTDKEAQEAYDKAVPVPMTKERIQEIVDYATGDIAKCELCGEPMPPGEQMFKFHGYSGPCPKPPLKKSKSELEMAQERIRQLEGRVAQLEVILARKNAALNAIAKCGVGGNYSFAARERDATTAEEPNDQKT